MGPLFKPFNQPVGHSVWQLHLRQCRQAGQQAYSCRVDFKVLILREAKVLQPSGS